MKTAQPKTETNSLAWQSILIWLCVLLLGRLYIEGIRLMDKEERLKQLAEHLARHIKNSHRGYDFPSQKDLEGYIYCGFRDYEYQHQNQEIQIVQS